MAETIGLLLLTTIGVSAEVAGATIIGSTTLASIVGSAALTAGLVGVSYLLAPSATQQGMTTPKPSDGVVTLKQAIPPRLFGYGRARIAGAYMLHEAIDGSYCDSYDVVALHDGRIEAIHYYYLNEDLVEINGAGVVTNVVGVTDGRYTSSTVTIKTRLGAATETAYSEVTTALPSIWTTDHRGDGIASAMLKCLAPGGPNVYYYYYPRGLPKLSVVADLTPIYDWRDVAQDRADPATWVVSRNPVVQLVDYITSAEHGLGQSWDDMIAPVLADLTTQADYCDEAIDLDGGGTEPRYQSSGWAWQTSDPADVLAEILKACDGWMAEGTDGTLAVWVGKYVAPTVTLTDDHIVAITVDHGVADEEVVNEIKATYTPALNDYREAPALPWRDEADITERGRVRSQPLALNWVESHGQARRLSKRAMARYLASRRGQMTTNLYGLHCLGQRWVAVQSGVIDDLADAVIEISRARVNLLAGQVTFEWALVNPNAIDAWDPATEQGEAPPVAGRLAGLLLPIPANMVLTPVAGMEFDVEIDDPANPDVSFAVQIRDTGASVAWTTYVFTTWTAVAGRVTLHIATLPGAGPDFEVQVASRNDLGVLSTFCAADTFTAIP